jgi:hypothetical protein
LIGFRAFRAERQVNAVVHAIAGKDELRLRFLQSTVETLMQIRTRKFATGVAFLAQTAHRLAAEAQQG